MQPILTMLPPIAPRRRFLRLLKLRTAYLAAAVTLGTGGAARAETQNKWYAYSSGNMLIAPSAEKVPQITGPIEKVTFNATDKLPGDYWVGAGVALDPPKLDNQIEFYIRKTTPQQRNVTMRVLDSKGAPGYYELNVPPDWIKVSVRRESPTHTDGGPAPADIAKIEFILNNNWFKPGETWSIDVAGMSTQNIQPMTFQDRYWTPATIPPPVPGYRVEGAIHNIFGMGSNYPGLDNPAGLPMAKEITTHFGELYGPWCAEIGYLRGENGKKFADFAHARGDLVAVTGHNHAGADEWEEGRPLTDKEKTDMYVRNAAGQSPVDVGFSFLHSMDFTNQRFLKGVQKVYMDSAIAGADVWRAVDHVWPYPQGGWTWTFADSQLKTWPKDLNETDGGLQLGKGLDLKKQTPGQVAHFWEYFESYHGYKMKPQDLGLASWDQYRPPQPGAPDSPEVSNNHTVINMLYHYEWLKFINESVRPAAEKYGMLTQPTTNPEEINNGTDLYWMDKLAFVRGNWVEWWGSAGVMIATYYNGRYYDNAAKTNGKELVLGGEASAAGGNPYTGQPYYCDNMSTYLVAYGQAASTDAKAQNQEYWAWSWDHVAPDRPEWAAATSWRCSFSGFLQARNEKAVKPKADVLALSTRAIAYGTPYFDWGSQQPYNLGQLLTEMNYLHDGGAFPLEDSFKLDDYKTVVMSTYQPPQGFMAKLGQWVGAEEGRTVITHSFVPTRFSAPASPAIMQPKWPAVIQPGGQEKVLGFGAITETKTVAGAIQSHDPAFKEFLRDWEGKAVTFSRGLCATAGTPGEKVLVSLGDQPLITEHAVGKGRVIYLHFFPNESGLTTAAVQRDLLSAVMRYAGYKRMAVMPPMQVAVMLQKGNGAKVFISLNYAANTAVLDKENRTWNCYQAQDPNVQGTARYLAGSPKTAFDVTDMITNRKQTLTSDADGYITVVNDGWNMRGVSVEKAGTR